jgi:hypothetical protein
MNKFYTHREFLENELNKIDVNKKSICIEFGTGDGSALIFRKYLEFNKNLNVISYENNKVWFDITSKKYQHIRYDFNFVENWDLFLLKNDFDNIYDIVFVDQAPFDARINCIQKIKNNAKVIILHDYNYYNLNYNKNILDVGFGSFFEKYHENFTLETQTKNLPPTLIMRNKKL